MRGAALWLAMGLIALGQDGLDEAIRLARAHQYPQAAAALAGVKVPEEAAQRVVYYRAKAAIEFGNGEAGASADAMEAALQASAQDPKVRAAAAVAQYHAGDFYEDHGENLKAVKAYQRAVELAPEEQEFQMALGLELLRHQAFEAATRVFAHATEQFPGSEKAQIGLGLAYYLDGQGGPAVEALLRAPAGSERAAGYLGQITLDRPEPPDAPAVERVCGFHSGQLLALCGGLLLRLEQNERALAKLREAVRLAPGDTAARCQLGKALDRRREWAEARAEMERCVELDPGSPQAHFRLARIYHRLGMPDAAKEQERLRAEAEQKAGAENDRRYESVRGFVVR